MNISKLRNTATIASMVVTERRRQLAELNARGIEWPSTRPTLYEAEQAALQAEYLLAQAEFAATNEKTALEQLGEFQPTGLYLFKTNGDAKLTMYKPGAYVDPTVSEPWLNVSGLIDADSVAVGETLELFSRKVAK
jgi:hypothetical protein